MKKIIVITALALASCQSTAHQVAYVNVGESTFQEEEIEDFDALETLEVGLLFGGEEDAEDRIVGAVGDIAFRAASGSDDVTGVAVDVETMAVRTGVRYYFDTGTPYLQPFIGGGFIFQQTSLESDMAPDDTADEFAAGGYGMIGLEAQVGAHFRAGVAYSMTGGVHPSIDGESYDVDTGTLLVGVGWSF